MKSFCFCVTLLSLSLSFSLPHSSSSLFDWGLNHCPPRSIYLWPLLGLDHHDDQICFLLPASLFDIYSMTMINVFQVLSKNIKWEQGKCRWTVNEAWFIHSSNRSSRKRKLKKKTTTRKKANAYVMTVSSLLLSVERLVLLCLSSHSHSLTRSDHDDWTLTMTNVHVTSTNASLRERGSVCSVFLFAKAMSWWD